MTNLFIHIGAPKTGTTAIQQFLRSNRDNLAAQGVLYPLGGMLKSAHHSLGAAIFPGRSSRLGTVSREDALKSAIDQIREEIADQNPHTVILSTEYLWGELSSANIRLLLQPFSDCSIKIFAYLRRQDLLAQSLYVQAVKGGSPETFTDWLGRALGGEKAGFDFHKVLSSWRDSGVATDLVVRVYEKSQIQADVCLDFLEAVCPGARPVVSAGKRSVNPGPDRTTIELLRLINRKVQDRELAATVRKRILANSAPRPLFAPLNYMSAADVGPFMDRFAEQNAAVARDFLGRSDGVLFRDSLPAQGGGSTEAVSPQAILEKLVDLLPPLTGIEAKETVAKPVRRAPAPTGGHKRTDFSIL